MVGGNCPLFVLQASKIKGYRNKHYGSKGFIFMAGKEMLENI
jgi:hypothetical protein